MAKILISEPHEDVRGLLAAMAVRLGYEPVSVRGVETVPADARVLVFEPAEPESLEHARALRRDRPGLVLVCVSIRPPEPDWLALDPIAYVIKPFTLDSLRIALAAATSTERSGPEAPSGRADGSPPRPRLLSAGRVQSPR
jgi:hypothetical protein